jgi:hypothetical protein
MMNRLKEQSYITQGVFLIIPSVPPLVKGGVGGFGRYFLRKSTGEGGDYV